MIRRVLLVLIPLVLPTLAYLAWTWLERRRAADGRHPWANLPWEWLAAAGVILVGLTLFITAITGGSAIHSVYQPAHLVDGKVVEGQSAPPEPGK